MNRALLLICVQLAVVSSSSCQNRSNPAGHTKSIASVAFSPDGKTLASGGWDGSIRLWDVATGNETAKAHAQSGGVLCVAFSPDGKRIVFGGSRVEIWDITMGKTTTAMDGRYAAMSAAFSPDGKSLAVGTPSAGEVILWDLAARKVAASLTYEGTYPDDVDPVCSVVFSPNGKTLAFGHLDNGEMMLWDVAASKKPAASLGQAGTPILAVAFSPDGRTLVSGGKGGRVKLWDVVTRKCVDDLAGYALDVNAVAFSPDGKTLALGGEAKSVRLWNLAQQKEVAVLKGHTDTVTSVAFSPDGTKLASGSMDKTIKLWDVKTCEQIWSR
jgi:WD40 repeat protein